VTRNATGIASASILVACAVHVPAPRAPSDRVAIVAAETGPGGARLVAIAENGDRRFELIRPAGKIVRDSNPAVSPDGRWVVFASTRGRNLDETSLWIAPLGVSAAPLRLTDRGIDSHPTWTPDGGAIVFASTRAKGNYDLWRIAIADGKPRGEPAQLTDAPGHEITPSCAADGAIVYAELTPHEDGSVETHLEERAPDGTIRHLTDGPNDSSPAVSPDGKTIAFARPVAHAATPDSELFRIARSGGEATQIVDVPLTDESGPVWSRDGRHLFATSLLRGADGRPVFSSIIYVDLDEPKPVARILEDRAGAILRLTPAMTRERLDAAALRKAPEYLPELGRIVGAAIAKQREQ